MNFSHLGMVADVVAVNEAEEHGKQSSESITKLEFPTGVCYGDDVRRRLVMGTIAAAIIGSGFLWYSNYAQRRENSIEYHKAEYLAARDGRPIMNEFRELLGKVTGTKHRHRMHADDLRVHGDALVRLGYWREETVVLSNRTALDIRKATILKTTRRPLTKEICVVSMPASNTLVVRAVPEHLPIWVGIFRDADVPENQGPK